MEKCATLLCKDKHREIKKSTKTKKNKKIEMPNNSKIEYKAMETRLKQMWVRKGVISVIDLSNDYFLVNFTHEDDQYVTLMGGPWFIYNHNLTVKEWVLISIQRMTQFRMWLSRFTYTDYQSNTMMLECWNLLEIAWARLLKLIRTRWCMNMENMQGYVWSWI